MRDFDETKVTIINGLRSIKFNWKGRRYFIVDRFIHMDFTVLAVYFLVTSSLDQQEYCSFAVDS